MRQKLSQARGGRQSPERIQIRLRQEACQTAFKCSKFRLHTSQAAQLFLQGAYPAQFFLIPLEVGRQVLHWRKPGIERNLKICS